MISYILGYVTKPEGKLSKQLRAVEHSMRNAPDREKIRKVFNTLYLRSMPAHHPSHALSNNNNPTHHATPVSTHPSSRS
jgi:hypothetical protein